MPDNFSMRFEGAAGMNPKKLIVAAHAGCFSTALSGQLGAAKLTAERIATTTTVILQKDSVGFTVTAVHLDVKAKVPGADKRAFDTAADNAKAGCPISRLLNAKITMSATLES